MAWRIVKQPDGNYARFSEVVDNFTHANMTRSEAFDYCHYYMGVEDAEEKVGNADKEPERWKEALKIIEVIHGAKEREDVEKEIANGRKTAEIS